MKKSVLMAAALVIAALLVPGCGKTNKAEVGTPENPYKIVWYNFGDKPHDFDAVEKKINEYIKPKIGAELKMYFQGMGADYEQKIKVLQASGDHFDLCFTSSWANDFRVAAQSGYLLPLNDPSDNLLEKYGKGILKEINPVLLKGTEINGLNYAIPCNKEAATQRAYVFNKKYIDKYKIDISKIKNVEDLLPIFKIVKDNEKGIQIFCPWESYALKDQDYVLNPSLPGAVAVQPGKPQIINQFDTSEMKHRLDVFREFYNKGYISDDYVIGRMPTAAIMAGKWFCRIDGYSPFADDIWSRQFGFPVVSVPTFEPPIIGNVSIAGAMVGISSTALRPDIDMKFLDLLNTDPYLRNLIGYGIDGIHYKKISENRIELLPKSKDYFMAQYTIGNYFITYLLPGDPDNKWEVFRKWNDSAVKSPLLGFAFNTKTVKSQIAAMTNVSKEFSNMFLGAMNPETELPKMNNKMKESGSDKVLAEMQKQVDEWWQNNEKNEKGETQK